MSFIYGLMTMSIWILNDDHRSIISYFLYTAGYSGVIFFQVFSAFP